MNPSPSDGSLPRAMDSVKEIEVVATEIIALLKIDGPSDWAAELERRLDRLRSNSYSREDIEWILDASAQPKGLQDVYVGAVPRIEWESLIGRLRDLACQFPAPESHARET